MDSLDRMDGRRCTATSKQSHQRCKRRPIPGGTVCVMHGGKAPQVQKAARERLAALIDPAIGRLRDLLTARNEGVQLGAVKDILDRNDLGPTKAPADMPSTFTINIGVVTHDPAA